MRTVARGENSIFMNNRRVLYFDYLRILATFAVVVIHVVSTSWDHADTRTLEWNVYNLYDGASRWAVPVFIMISGALFLGRQQSINRLFKAYIRKMCIVFAFWSTLYALWGYYITCSITTAEIFVRELIVGRYHLWFLPTIIGLYLIVPFLDKIVEDKKNTFYFLILAFLFSFLIPQCIRILGFIDEELSQAFSGLQASANIHFMIGYSGYYVLGYALNITKLSEKQIKVIYIAGICGLVFTIAATAVASILMHTPITVYGHFTINTLCVAAAVFTFAKEHFNDYTSVSREKRLAYLSKSCFGVYLIHLFVLDILSEFIGLTTQSFNQFLSVPVISLLVYFISLCLSLALNKVRFVRQWLM